MNNEILLLSATAASLGIVHTALGPDHYLPFIVMSKARKWSALKTAWITIICGFGHVASSIILGIIGILAGMGVNRLQFVESIRGDWAAWAFVLFGVVYTIWGFFQAKKHKTHKHVHTHGATVHEHEHGHEHSKGEVLSVPHNHAHKSGTKQYTFWVLFLIFVLGPCEPLIPVLMYPAVNESYIGLGIVTAVFTIATLLTMVGIVMAFYFGVKLFKTNKLEKYTHAIAGITILISGVLILIGL